jgi:hypothetical protein
MIFASRSAARGNLHLPAACRPPGVYATLRQADVAMFDAIHPKHHRSGVVRRKHGNFVQKFRNSFWLSPTNRRLPLRSDHPECPLR